MVKRIVVILCGFVFALKVSAQKIDSIYFNLYTDSLKKGTYNYINIEGRYSDGRYLPLGEKELKFSTSAGSFSGNSLFIDSSYKGEKVTVWAVLLSDSAVIRETTIYIKKQANPDRLPTVEEILSRPAKLSRKTPKKLNSI